MTVRAGASGGECLRDVWMRLKCVQDDGVTTSPPQTKALLVKGIMVVKRLLRKNTSLDDHFPAKKRRVAGK